MALSDAYLRTRGKADRMGMHDVVVEQLLEPVGIPVLGSPQVAGAAGIVVAQLSGSDHLVHAPEHTALRVGDRLGQVEPALLLHVHVDRHLVLRIHDVEIPVGGNHAVGEFTRIIDGAHAGTAPLGRDDDHTGHGSCSVYRGCRSVLEDVETFDVFRVESGNGRSDQRRGVTRREGIGIDIDDILHDDTVHDPQRLGAAIDRRGSADTDLGGGTERTGDVLHRHSGRTPLQTAADVGHTGQFHVVGDQLVGGSRKQTLVHLRHTRYHDRLDILRIGFKLHPNIGCDIDILGLVTHIRDLEFSRLGHSRKLELSFDTGGSTNCRAILDNYGSTDDRCSGLIDDQTLDRLRLGRGCHQTKNRQ